MKKKNFTKDYLINELFLPDEAIEDIIIDNTRWTAIRRIVFQDKDGKYYQTTYSIGSTEMQCESPWEYEETIECLEVELREVVRKEWCPVETGSKATSRNHSKNKDGCK